jgi:hypothetical protein
MGVVIPRQRWAYHVRTTSGCVERKARKSRVSIDLYSNDATTSECKGLALLADPCFREYLGSESGSPQDCRDTIGRHKDDNDDDNDNYTEKNSSEVIPIQWQDISSSRHTPLHLVWSESSPTDSRS